MESDENLVARALQTLPRNNYKAAEKLGVSEGKVRRMRKGEGETLRDETRNALVQYLGGGARQGAALAAQTAPARQVDEINRDTFLSPAEKERRIAEVAALYRSEALREEAAAARERAAAARMEAEVALARVTAPDAGRVSERQTDAEVAEDPTLQRAGTSQRRAEARRRGS
jgi:hypothetical protein